MDMETSFGTITADGSFKPSKKHLLPEELNDKKMIIAKTMLHSKPQPGACYIRVDQSPKNSHNSSVFQNQSLMGPGMM